MRSDFSLNKYYYYCSMEVKITRKKLFEPKISKEVRHT